MNTTLIGNVNNEFFKQRNALTGRNGEITVLVEDYADTYLWLTLLKTACPDRIFRVIPYQEGDNLSQSKPLIAKEIKDKGGELYIGCIDSDLNYLLRYYGNELGMKIEQTDYLFQTYAYSMENLLCMPSTLAQVIVSMTSLQSSFPFESFFIDFSEKLYPLILTDLFLRSKHSKTVIGVDKWKHILPSDKTIKRCVTTNMVSGIISDLEKKIRPHYKRLLTASEYDANELYDFERSILAANNYLNKQNCCLFIYGHEMIQFVNSLVSFIAEETVHNEKARISAHSNITQEVKTEKLQHIDNQHKAPPKKRESL